MSNLGWYQVLTTTAKAVGGPKTLIGLLVGGGAIVGGVTVAGIGKLNKEADRKRKLAESVVIHTVHTEGKSNEGLLFRVGDKFRVLDSDGDAGLIEKIDDENNPYFVSLRFLGRISDYESA